MRIIGFLDYLSPEFREELQGLVAKFENLSEDMRHKGLINYNGGVQRQVYVGPGHDPSSEELRAIVRIDLNLLPEVPVEPIAGSELYVQAIVASDFIWRLTKAASSSR